MELEISNCQSSLLSSSLASHLRFLVLFFPLFRIFRLCSGLWFGSKPAEDRLAMMDRGHGSWPMMWFAYVGPRRHQVLCCERTGGTLGFLGR